MSFIIKNHEISDEVRKFIYLKQVELKMDAKHPVSLGKTIEKLIKDAYLTAKK